MGKIAMRTKAIMRKLANRTNPQPVSDPATDMDNYIKKSFNEVHDGSVQPTCRIDVEECTQEEAMAMYQSSTKLNKVPDLYRVTGQTFEENENVWRHQLIHHLILLKDKKIKLIEFGDPTYLDGTKPHYFTRIRIRITKTPGGEQYGVRLVDTFRGEGGGAYFPLDDDGVTDVLKYCRELVEKYTKPHSNPAIRKFMEEQRGNSPRPVLRFTGFLDESHLEPAPLQRLHAKEEAEGRGFLPGAETIYLG